jgi:hypothetical protein
LVFGRRYIGKSHVAKQIIEQYTKPNPRVGRDGRPVLTIDVQNEYNDYIAINYDVDQPDKFKRCSEIKKIKSPNIYRILCFKKDRSCMDDTEKMRAILDAAQFFRNGLILLEDMNTYLSSHVPKRFYSMIVSVRHIGTDLIMNYQRKNDPPPKVWDSANLVRMHKTTDSISSEPRNKKNVPHYKLIYIAEKIVDFKYHQGNERYYNIIDIDRGKIVQGIDKVDFISACTEYYWQNQREVKLEMKKRAGSKKKFKSEQEAIRHLVKNDIRVYFD